MHFLHRTTKRCGAANLSALLAGLCLCMLALGCGVLPKIRNHDYILDDAKALAPSLRATITARDAWTFPVICLREVNGELFYVKSAGLLGHNPFEFFGLPNLQAFRIAVKPGPIEVGLIALYGTEGRSGVVRVKIDAVAGKHYIISPKVTNNPDGTQKWEPIITEK